MTNIGRKRKERARYAEDPEAERVIDKAVRYAPWMFGLQIAPLVTRVAIVLSACVWLIVLVLVAGDVVVYWWTLAAGAGVLTTACALYAPAVRAAAWGKALESKYTRACAVRSLERSVAVGELPSESAAAILRTWARTGLAKRPRARRRAPGLSPWSLIGRKKRPGQKPPRSV